MISSILSFSLCARELIPDEESGFWAIGPAGDIQLYKDDDVAKRDPRMGVSVEFGKDLFGLNFLYSFGQSIHKASFKPFFQFPISNVFEVSRDLSMAPMVGPSVTYSYTNQDGGLFGPIRPASV